jgi:hypothetical protein
MPFPAKSCQILPNHAIAYPGKSGPATTTGVEECQRRKPGRAGTREVYRQLLLPLDGWFEEVQDARNSYASWHALHARRDSLRWQEFARKTVRKTVTEKNCDSLKSYADARIARIHFFSP